MGKKVVVKSKEASSGEECERCGSKEFSISANADERRYCGCGHVWGPMTAEQVEAAAHRKEFLRVKEENDRLRKENNDLKKQLNILS